MIYEWEIASDSAARSKWAELVPNVTLQTEGMIETETHYRVGTAEPTAQQAAALVASGLFSVE